MKNEMIRLEEVITMIYWIRNEKVMLDRDLAKLYGVETKVLKQAVKRNIERFPLDFMFILNNQEFTNWRSQFVTSNAEKMGLAFVMLRHELINFDKIQIRIDKMEYEINAELSEHQDKIQLILEAIKQLIASPQNERRQIGYKRNENP